MLSMFERALGFPQGMPKSVREAFFVFKKHMPNKIRTLKIVLGLLGLLLIVIFFWTDPLMKPVLETMLGMLKIYLNMLWRFVTYNFLTAFISIILIAVAIIHKYERYVRQKEYEEYLKEEFLKSQQD